ncbi:hypothetical protein OF83DRAFT_363317 [Amylostereum chailletii]|nr:hypothetical protein OF83DRAFT_363317 [Amylostereum chailletii]
MPGRLLPQRLSVTVLHDTKFERSVDLGADDGGWLGAIWVWRTQTRELERLDDILGWSSEERHSDGRRSRWRVVVQRKVGWLRRRAWHHGALLGHESRAFAGRLCAPPCPAGRGLDSHIWNARSSGRSPASTRRRAPRVAVPSRTTCLRRASAPSTRLPARSPLGRPREWRWRRSRFPRVVLIRCMSRSQVRAHRFVGGW